MFIYILASIGTIFIIGCVVVTVSCILDKDTGPRLYEGEFADEFGCSTAVSDYWDGTCTPMKDDYEDRAEGVGRPYN